MLPLLVLATATYSGGGGKPRPNWQARYRRLLPFSEAQRVVQSIGFSSKEDWDEWVSEGKSTCAAAVS